jgi:hypothetical protein
MVFDLDFRIAQVNLKRNALSIEELFEVFIS